MNNTLRLSLISVVGLVGCAATRAETLAEMRTAPICDGSDQLRLGYNVDGGQVENTYQFTNPFGWQFFAIDGKCHYYVSRHENEGVVEGVLSEAEAERMSAELHYGELPEKSAAFGATDCFDASGQSLYYGSTQLVCGCSCDGASTPSADAMKHASSWLHTLADSGAPLDGAIRAIAKLRGRVGVTKFNPTYDWPLDTPMNKIDGLVIQEGTQLPADIGVRFEGSDAQALRELRATSTADAKKAEAEGRHVQTLIVNGTAEMLEYKLFLQDELPEADVSAIEKLFDSR